MPLDSMLTTDEFDSPALATSQAKVLITRSRFLLISLWRKFESGSQREAIILCEGGMERRAGL